jgi:hypothetical protein
MTQSAPAAPRNRRTLYLLLAVFFGPLLVSFTLYYFTDWRPVAQSNHGELVSPPRPLPEPPASLLGEWSIVYIGDAACDADCRSTLVFGRQVRLALNKEMTRVRRVLLATAGCCTSDYLTAEHAGLVLEDARAPGREGLLATFPADAREHSLFVVDPRGNLVMRYDARQDPKGFLTDLKKLLRLSHIG